MADIDAIRKAIAANLSAIPDCQVLPYFSEAPTPATLQVAGIEVTDYVQSMGPDASFIFIVEGVCDVSAIGLIASQKRFDRWIAPTGEQSIRQALYADTNLTSRVDEKGQNLTTGHEDAADDIALIEFRGYRRQTVKGVEVLLGDFAVQVETSA